MNRQILVSIVLGNVILGIVMSIALLWGPALAASEETLSSQLQANSAQFVSISAMAFQPAQPNIPYFKDLQRQLLGLTAQTQNALFVAPLTLQDRSELVGLTVFWRRF